MRNEKRERKFDFRPVGLAIKKARERQGMTQEQLDDIIGRDTRTVMYHENDGQHPSLDIFYQLATIFNISVDQFFFTNMSADEAAKKRINILLNSLNESELRLVEGIIRTIKENRETEDVCKNACWGASPNPVVCGPTLTCQALTLGQNVPKRKSRGTAQTVPRHISNVQYFAKTGQDVSSYHPPIERARKLL